MANTKNTNNGFTFGTYVKPESVNPYTDVVKQLDEMTRDNPAASVTFLVSPDNVSTATSKFRAAANAIDRTARLVNVEEDTVDGLADVALTFTIGPKHKSGRGRKPKSE